MCMLNVTNEQGFLFAECFFFILQGLLFLLGIRSMLTSLEKLRGTREGAKRVVNG